MSVDVLQDAEVESSAAESTSKYTHLAIADIRTILDLHSKGVTQIEIARVVGRGQATVSRTINAFASDAKSIALQMRALTDETIEDWRAARTIAAKRGDHRPARELLEAAYPDLRPQPANTGITGGVTVIVAVPNSGHNPLPIVEITRDVRPVTMVTPEIAVSEGRGLEPQLSQGSAGSPPQRTFASDVSPVSSDLHRLTDAT